MTYERAVEILLVKDHSGGVRLTQEAHKDSKIFHYPDDVRPGEAPINYPRQEEKFGQIVRLYIIGLNLHLLKPDGRHIREEIKTDDSLKGIPAVIMIALRVEQDTAACNLQGKDPRQVREIETFCLR